MERFGSRTNAEYGRIDHATRGMSVRLPERDRVDVRSEIGSEPTVGEHINPCAVDGKLLPFDPLLDETRS